MAALPAVFYVYAIWTNTGTPYGDGYIQSIFTVIQYLDSSTPLEKIANTWWTYFQNRALFTKAVTLSLYFLMGYLDFQIIGAIAGLMLCAMVYLIAQSILLHKMPLYCIPVASLMILSFYPWTVITWPECALFYFGTLMLAYACFYLLDLPKPQVLAALVCASLATLTMANGLLSIVIGSLLVIYKHFCCKRFSNAQIWLWFTGAAACSIFHLATMNVFQLIFMAQNPYKSLLSTYRDGLWIFLNPWGLPPSSPMNTARGKSPWAAFFWQPWLPCSHPENRWPLRQLSD
ncbi:MAG: hypothetical protein IPK95_12240 [Cellvibrionales bacterium]|nr:hypothetical protein [Cellvibrionales bacterium]